MLYLSLNGPPDHLELMRLRACAELESICNQGLHTVDEAQRRGKFLDSELDSMRRGIHRNQYNLTLNNILLERRGLKAPDRSRMFTRGHGTATGCFVTRGEGRPQLFIYGSLGSDYGEVQGSAVVNHLEEIGDDVDVDLRLNSPGGQVKDADMIIRRIKARVGRTACYIDGMANSAASLISMVCTPIYIRRDAVTMIHYCGISAGLEGRQTAADLERALERVRSVDDEIIEYYLPRWRGTLDELQDALKEERGFTAEEAVEWGLCDCISDAKSLATASQIEEAWSRESTNPGNVFDRRAFEKYRTEFQCWRIAAKAMPYDNETLLQSIHRRKRDEKKFVASTLDLVPERLRAAAKKCRTTV